MSTKTTIEINQDLRSLPFATTINESSTKKLQSSAYTTMPGIVFTTTANEEHT
jgi:hypothetical protein